MDAETIVRKNGARAVEGTRTDLLSQREREKRRKIKEAHKAYGRGKKIDTRSIKDKKLRSSLKRLEENYQNATLKAKDAEILLENTAGFLEPEGELERTWKVRQDDITKSVAVETAQKKFDLKLDQLGPYVCDYTRNGRELLLAGRKGHIATMDWREGKLGCEIQLGETVRDAKWLHNNQYFAVSQKNHVFIYDHNGVELHRLAQHREVSHMEFLPYHFLLATIVSKLFISSGPELDTDLHRETLAFLNIKILLQDNWLRKSLLNSDLLYQCRKIPGMRFCTLGIRTDRLHYGHRAAKNHW